MKKIIIFIIIAIQTIFFNSCSLSRDYVNLEKRYELNMESAVSYYEKSNLILSDYGVSTKPVYISLNTKIKCKRHVYIEYSGRETPVAYEFKSAKVARDYYSKSFYQSSSVYSVYNNIIYTELLGTYVLLNGEPLYKNEIYFDSVNNDIILLSESKNTNMIFEDISKIIPLAFENSNLETICFKQKLKYIGSSAFVNSSNLSYVYLNEGLEYIGKSAFAECSALKYIVIPKSVKTIGSNAFTDGIIYCEAESKPKGWADNFYRGSSIVYYKGQWEYDANGVPKPNSLELLN